MRFHTSRYNLNHLYYFILYFMISLNSTPTRELLITLESTYILLYMGKIFEILMYNRKLTWLSGMPWDIGLILLIKKDLARMWSSFVVLRIGTVPLGHWTLSNPNMGLLCETFTLVLPIVWKLGFLYRK